MFVVQQFVRLPFQYNATTVNHVGALTCLEGKFCVLLNQQQRYSPLHALMNGLEDFLHDDWCKSQLRRLNKPEKSSILVVIY